MCVCVCVCFSTESISLPQSRFLYYNANDPRILVGDFELRRFGVRPINAGHPLLLPYLCLSNIVGSVVTAPVAGT